MSRDLEPGHSLIASRDDRSVDALWLERSELIGFCRDLTIGLAAPSAAPAGGCRKS